MAKPAHCLPFCFWTLNFPQKSASASLSHDMKLGNDSQLSRTRDGLQYNNSFESQSSFVRDWI